MNPAVVQAEPVGVSLSSANRSLVKLYEMSTKTLIMRDIPSMRLTKLRQ